MRITKFASAVLASVALAACGGGDSGNVMAPDVNTLSPAQIDAALGPENGAVISDAPVTADVPGNPAPAAGAPASKERAVPAEESEAPEPEPANAPAAEPPAADDNAAVE